MYMGYEFERRRFLRGEREAIGPQFAFLHDYHELTDPLGGPGDDHDAEVTWPEGMADQFRMLAIVRACGWDDAEEDDAPGGNITDEPHDAREEDGI